MSARSGGAERERILARRRELMALAATAVASTGCPMVCLEPQMPAPYVCEAPYGEQLKLLPSWEFGPQLYARRALLFVGETAQGEWRGGGYYDVVMATPTDVLADDAKAMLDELARSPAKAVIESMTLGIGPVQRLEPPLACGLVNGADLAARRAQAIHAYLLERGLDVPVTGQGLDLTCGRVRVGLGISVCSPRRLMEIHGQR